jgi:hypothetical protein
MTFEKNAAFRRFSLTLPVFDVTLFRFSIGFCRFYHILDLLGIMCASSSRTEQHSHSVSMMVSEIKIRCIYRSLIVLLFLVGILTVISAADLSAQEDVPRDSVSSAGLSDSIVQEHTDAPGAVPNQVSWLYTGRLNVLIIVAFFFLLVLVLTSRARGGRDIPLREISGIQAIETVIERAAQVGKPVVYVPGVFDVDNIQTIASMAILVDVARKTAEKDVRLIVPLNRAFLIPLAEESVKRGMGEAGKRAQYNPDDIRYLSDDHFAYAAAVDGIMLRERPAATLYLGGFGAEALILAEMGYSAGAVQVAGTAEIQQLPFLVTACDHTLIGEEFYAASAYISRESKLLGSLRAADAVKVIIIMVLILGSILELIGIHTISKWLIVQ